MPAGSDQIRCPWCGDDPLYQAYHDEEWGMPINDDRELFEFLVLESAQAGLSWITILRKREAYREAFADFDPVAVSAFSSADLERLMNNPGIVRNQLKINAAINNAGHFLDIQAEFGSFSRYLWAWVDSVPLLNHYATLAEVPAQTAVSQALSKDLKKRGMKFVGPTIMYAYMQSVGMVNDHLVDCAARQRCIKAGKTFSPAPA